MISIDDFTEKFDVAGVNVIKVDVEGMEYDVLKGAKNTIMKFKIYIKLNPRNSDVKLIFKFL